jgi:hypothetical protein
MGSVLPERSSIFSPQEKRCAQTPDPPPNKPSFTSKFVRRRVTRTVFLSDPWEDFLLLLVAAVVLGLLVISGFG